MQFNMHYDGLWITRRKDRVKEGGRLKCQDYYSNSSRLKRFLLIASDGGSDGSFVSCFATLAPEPDPKGSLVRIFPWSLVFSRKLNPIEEALTRDVFTNAFQNW